MIQDSEMMARSGVRTTLAELESFLLLLGYDREAQEVRDSSKRLFQSDLLRLGEECFFVVVRVAQCLSFAALPDITLRRHLMTMLLASVYISGISTTTPDHRLIATL